MKNWRWPVRGKLINRFRKNQAAYQGIDIRAKYMSPIVASAPGQIVYSGSGVRGYGNLIIVKHSQSFLSAYAFNQRNLVHNGDWVKRGQPIALMGRNIAGKVMLHFEIRKNGRPVNPLQYLR